MSLLVALPAGAAVASPDGPDERTASARTDFNCDGFADLAIGVPYDAVDGIEDSGGGAVEVLYGSGKGLQGTAPHAQHLNRDTPDVPGDPAPNESFGGAVIAGDFDGDGCSELVIGAPGTDGRSSEVLVLAGTEDGVTVDGDHPAQVVRPGGAWNATDKFGDALAVGDFDGDGRDDLAIGAPADDVDWMFGEVADAGSVTVLYGSSGGLRTTSRSTQYWHQNSVGMADAAEAGDAFGSSLAAGDFDGDGAADLAIGVPGEDVGTVHDAGGVQTLLGSPDGLVADGEALWQQDRVGVADVAEDGDRLGESMVAADFGADGYADLAVGVRFEDVGAATGAGAVHVFEGSIGGLSSGDQFLHQDQPGVAGVAESGDVFGSALAAGDFDGDGAADLAVGSPSDEELAQGSATIFYGSASSDGLVVAGNVLEHQNSGDVPGAAASNESFGAALSASDFDRDGRADLVVGVPNDKRDAGAQSAGVVNVLYGAARGTMASARSQLWFQNDAGVGGVPHAFEFFGAALS